MDERTRKIRQERRRKKRIRQRRIARARRLGLIICLAAIALAAVNGIRGRLAVNKPDAAVAAPQKMDKDEIMQKIMARAQENSDYARIYENMDAYPQELLNALCNNDEMLDFVCGYPTAEKRATGGFSLLERREEYPVILQWDKRWGYAAYGESNIGLAGCGPTCLSIVALHLTGNAETTPDAVADYAMEHGYYTSGAGTSWGLMTEGADHFGVKGEELPLDEERIITSLKQDRPIICSLRPGDFTTSGHYIVLTGTKDDKIVVRDPNSRARSERLWEYDTLSPQIKNLWVFRTK